MKPANMEDLTGGTLRSLSSGNNMLYDFLTVWIIVSEMYKTIVIKGYIQRMYNFANFNPELHL